MKASTRNGSPIKPATRATACACSASTALMCRGTDGKLKEASWPQAFEAIASRVKGLKREQIAALAGNLACAESVAALKDLLDSMGVVSRDCRQEGAKIDVSSRANYLFNTTIEGIEQADVCLIVGANPRREAAMVNARIRKAWKKGGLKVYRIGGEAELTYPYESLGNDPRILADIASGKHALA